MKLLLPTAIALGACLLLAGCKESGGPEPANDEPRVFPDLAVAAPVAPVDVAGALALTSGAIGTIQAGDIAAVTVGGRCALDSVNGQEADGVELSRTEASRFSGWVASAGPAPAIAILLVGDAIYALPAQPLADRPDVAAAIGLADQRVSDFQAEANLAGAKPGEYAVHLLLDQAGTPVSCSLNRRVTLR